MTQDLATIAKSWLDREDSKCSADRRARLEWVASLAPEAEYLTFPGGWVAKYLFEEARYSIAGRQGYLRPLDSFRLNGVRRRNRR